MKTLRLFILIAIAAATAHAHAEGKQAQAADGACLSCLGIDENIYNEIQRGKIEAAMEASIEFMKKDIGAKIEDMMKMQEEIGYADEEPRGRLSGIGQLIEVASRTAQEAYKVGTYEAVAKAQKDVLDLHKEVVRISRIR